MIKLPNGQHVDGCTLLQWMNKNGIQVTRKSYIELAWGSLPPYPWTGDHEAALPADLQDWTKCEPDEQPGD